MSREIVNTVVMLRGKRAFQEAINLVDNNRDKLDESSRIPALIRAFEAAQEAGYEIDAKRFALEIAQEHPDLPSIQPYLPAH